MTTDPDHRPATYDEAAEFYEQSPDFLSEAIDAVGNPEVYKLPPIPDALREAIQDWYRTTPLYTQSVEAVQRRLSQP